MAKKTTPEQRVKEARERERRWKAAQIPLADIGKGPPIERPARPRWWDHSLDLNNPDNFNSLAGLALRIENEDPDRELLLRTFEAFGFDHNDPPHWRKLLSVLADAHFREKKVGTPKRVDDLQTLEDVATFKREHPGCNDSDMFKLMAGPGEFEGRYLTDKAVRERWKCAIAKPVKNGIARSLPKARAQVERAGKPWTRKVEDEECEKIRLAVIDGLLEGALRLKTDGTVALDFLRKPNFY